MDSTLVANYLLQSGRIHRYFHSPVYIPQSLPLEIAELTLNDYFFADMDSDIDYGLLYLYADQLQFDSERFASQQLIESLSGGEKLKIQLIKKLAIFWYDFSGWAVEWLGFRYLTLAWKLYHHEPKDHPICVSHDEDFLSRTATKIIHLESVKKKALAQTKVEELDYQDYAQKRQQAYQKQVQQARNDQKEIDKALNKHLRQKSQVRNTLLNTHDATMGRLIAKKMKNVLSRENAMKEWRKISQKYLFMQDAISLFFSDISPLPARKQVLHLENFQLNVESEQLS